MAVILPVMLLLLAFPLLFGRMFWHYAVIQSAAHDAATYLSRVPIAEMTSSVRGSRAADLAHDIVAAEAAELSPGGDYPVSIGILCDGAPCDYGVPVNITVEVRVRMYDPFFSEVTWAGFGDNGLSLRAKVAVRYVGQ
ncbi:MAG: pilus assembly protein [Pseudomonadota bacterium]|nr:pilus assembly protein [Pseudomonadota bacterium]